MSIIQTEEHTKETKLSDQTIIIYGDAKTGKSTLCSCFDDILYVATETGYKHLDLKYKPTVIRNWKEMKAMCNQLAKMIQSGECKFKTIVIDTLDELDRMCVEFILDKNGINELGELTRADGYLQAKNELMGLLKGLESLGLGLVVVSHGKDKKMEKTVGIRVKEWDKKVLNLSPSRATPVVHMFDIVIYMSTEIDEDGNQFGTATTKPSMYCEAGDRSKRLPEVIKFDPANPKTLYDKIASVFD